VENGTGRIADPRGSRRSVIGGIVVALASSAYNWPVDRRLDKSLLESAALSRVSIPGDLITSSAAGFIQPAALAKGGPTASCPAADSTTLD